MSPCIVITAVQWCTQVGGGEKQGRHSQPSNTACEMRVRRSQCNMWDCRVLLFYSPTIQALQEIAPCFLRSLGPQNLEISFLIQNKLYIFTTVVVSCHIAKDCLISLSKPILTFADELKLIKPVRLGQLPYYVLLLYNQHRDVL